MTTPRTPQRRRATKLLLVGMGLLLAAAAAGVTLFLKTLDAEIYKRALERELSSVLNRTASIGSLSFNLAIRPTLSVRDLRIANPPWASRPDFVTATSGEARIDLIALWNGRVELRAVRLSGVDLLLERNAQGEGNWAFGASDRGDKRAALPDFGTVSLADAHFAWRQSDDSIGRVRIDTAEATISDGAPFQLHAQGDYREAPMRLTVEANASLQAALNGKPWRLSVGLEPKGASLTLDVRLASIESLEGLELGFEMTGEHLDAWSGVVGQALPRWGPYLLSAQARYVRGSLQVEDLSLSLDGLPMQPSRVEIGAGKAVLGARVDTRLTAEGKVGETAFSLEVSSAPLPQLQKAGGVAPVTLRAALADFTLSANGSVEFTAGGTDFDLAVSARGDALAPLRVIAGVRPSRPLPVDLAARLTHAKEGYSAKNIRGRVLGFTVAGDLAYARVPRALLSGALNLGQLDLNQLDVKALESAGAPETRPRDIAGASGPSWLERVEGDLSLRIAAISGLPVPAKNLIARVQWRDDVVRLQGLGATLADTHVTGDGTLRWRDGRPQIDGNASIAVLDFAKFGSGVAYPRSGSALDDRLPLAPLRALDANLQFDIARIAGAPVAIGKVAALAHLRGGKLAIDVASATVANVPLQGRVTLDASGSAWRVDANARADRIDLAALLLHSPNRPGTTSGVIQGLQVLLGSQGTSPRDLLTKAKLSVRSAPFSLAVGRDRSPVAVERSGIEVEPGGPVRASAVGSAFGAPMNLTVVAGPLAELLDPETAWPKMEANLRTALGGEPFHIVATSGPLQRLIGLRDVPLALQATLPGARATLEGNLNNLAAPTATPLAGRVEIANLAQTAALFTASRLPALPFSAAGRITLGDGEVAIDDLSAQAGRSDAAGRLRIRWRDRPDLSADLTSKLIDATQWEEPTANEIPVLDRPIPVQSLLSRDAQLRLRAERFVLNGYDLAKLQLDGTLTNGLIEFSTAAAEGDLRGDLRFDLRQDVPGVALRLSLKEVETRALYTAASGPSGAATPLLSMRAQLAGSGATLRNILAAGHGEFLLTAGSGTLPIESGYGFEKMAGNLLLVLVPGRRAEDHAQLECAAARFSIANGVATSSDGIALRLKHMVILGSGAANLQTSQILFGYRAVRREFFSFSLLGLTSGLAKVTGTINGPTVELDPSGILIAGTAAWSTAGLSLLAGGLWRKLESTADPCARIAAGAQLSSDPLDVLIRSSPSVNLPFPSSVKP